MAKELPDNHVESVVYPTYETKGELEQATEGFLTWYGSCHRTIDALSNKLNPQAERTCHGDAQDTFRKSMAA